MISYLTIGIILGLSAGFAPGPLLTLVISETLQHGIRSGIKIALAPIITDMPIIFVTLFILAKLSSFHHVLGIISLAGGFFILTQAYQNIRLKTYEFKIQETQPNSLAKGILANALSPHPYLFWLSVGAPIMNKAMSINIFTPLIFVVSFYTLLVSSKIVLAILVGRYKSFLSGPAYLYTIRFLGLVLSILALLLFIDGLKLLGITALA